MYYLEIELEGFEQRIKKYQAEEGFEQRIKNIRIKYVIIKIRIVRKS